ncbi:MAG TPA: FAD-dependent oxidoreductase [Thermoleophilaceae bacterium]|nr:FAD-dependent oxidoreductase [Thermoleophilaceae bacterium]
MTEVAIAGAGVAGLEALIGLRALAGERVRITLVAPGPDFVYRPASVAEPFGQGRPRRYALAAIAEAFQAELVEDALERVDGRARCLHTTSGATIAYDALLLALGATPEPVWRHAVTFAGSADAQAVRAVVTAVEQGRVQSVAFVVPSGVAWSLPAYELALMTAKRARDAGQEPELVVYTPERQPLAVFGREAAEEVAGVLDQAGVRLARSVAAEGSPAGELVVPFEETPIAYERVIALPRLAGPAVPGVPHDRDGFIPIDRHARVVGAQGLYAAGDGTNFGIKQGGIAAAQADAAAEMIAAEAGVDIDPRPFRPTLKGKLLTGGTARFLRSDRGPGAPASTAATSPLWWPQAKIAANYLAPYLAAQDAAAGLTESIQPAAGVQELPGLGGPFEDSPWGE